MSKVDQNITQTTSIIAHYLPSGEDRSRWGDGLVRTLSIRESQSGTKAMTRTGMAFPISGRRTWTRTIVDLWKTGESPADSHRICYAIPRWSWPRSRVNRLSSSESKTYLEQNGSLSTSSLHGRPTYHFAYWSVNGVRQAGPTGVSMSKVRFRRQIHQMVAGKFLLRVLSTSLSARRLSIFKLPRTKDWKVRMRLTAGTPASLTYNLSKVEDMIFAKVPPSPIFSRNRPVSVWGSTATLGPAPGQPHSTRR